MCGPGVLNHLFGHNGTGSIVVPTTPVRPSTRSARVSPGLARSVPPNWPFPRSG